MRSVVLFTALVTCLDHVPGYCTRSAFWGRASLSRLTPPWREGEGGVAQQPVLASELRLILIVHVSPGGLEIENW